MGKVRKTSATKKELSSREKRDSLPKKGLAAVIIVITVYLAFYPSLKCGFTNWDDDTYVTQNSMVISSHVPWKEIFTIPVALNYHPLTVLSLAFNYQVAKLNPSSYHLINLFIHILNTLLLFFFIYQITGKKIFVASITALLFGVHPMHVESVTWISERKDVLYVFFFLAALLFYLRYQKTKHLFFLATCFILFVCSCLSKAMAVVFPVVLLLSDYYAGIKMNRKSILEKIPFFLVSFTLGIIALTIQSGSANSTIRSFDLLHRFLFASYGLLLYILKFLLPVNLSAIYPYPVTDQLQSLPIIYYAAPVLIAILIYFVFRFFRQDRSIIFGLLFFFITVALVLQFISVGNALMADRYSYLSYAGLAFIAGNFYELAAERLPRSRMLLNVVFASWMVGLCLLTNDRVQVWNNSETLWSDVIKKYPLTTTAYKNRGNFYGQHGKVSEALNDYETLLNMDTKDPEVFNNLANIYALQNKISESLNASSKAISLNPDYESAYINRGITYSSMKEYEKAIADFSKAISLNPEKAGTYLQRGVAHYLDGNFQLAINDFTQTLKLEPSNGAAYYYRGLSNISINKNDQGLHDLQEARALGYENDYSMINKK